jgi:uncharacterized ferritin-like protein (DUF455 family)
MNFSVHRAVVASGKRCRARRRICMHAGGIHKRRFQPPGVRIIALIHEAAHILWPSVDHAANFRHAECYASFVGDLFGGTGGGPACPTP